MIETIVAGGDHDGSFLQKILVGQFKSFAVARQQSYTKSSSGIETPAMTDLDRPAFIVMVIGENELWFELKVVRGIDVFWTWSECCQLDRVVEDIPQMSMRKVTIPDMFRTSDILNLTN
jgi:hypothetical protein